MITCKGLKYKQAISKEEEKIRLYSVNKKHHLIANGLQLFSMRSKQRKSQPIYLEELQFFKQKKWVFCCCRIYIGADCSRVVKTGYTNPNQLTEVLNGQVIETNYDEFWLPENTCLLSLTMPFWPLKFQKFYQKMQNTMILVSRKRRYPCHHSDYPGYFISIVVVIISYHQFDYLKPGSCSRRSHLWQKGCSPRLLPSTGWPG